MQDGVRAIKFQKVIDSLKNGDRNSLIEVVNRDETDDRFRDILLSVIETGDIRNLDYEFDGGNVNLAYKSAEELLYSLELKKEYPVIILYKATGCIDPMIVYRDNQTLSCDLEKRQLIFKNHGEEIIQEIGTNKTDAAISMATKMSAFKLSPDPSVILEVLNEIIK